MTGFPQHEADPYLKLDQVNNGSLIGGWFTRRKFIQNLIVFHWMVLPPMRFQ